jgi:hypothetical protein
MQLLDAVCCLQIEAKKNASLRKIRVGPAG